MKIKNYQTIFLLIGFVFWSKISSAQDYVTIPELKSIVTDLTGTLSSGDAGYLENKLRQFESQKGSQIAVLIVATTQPEEIEQYAIRVAEKWKLGREDIDDGILLLVAKEDRKVRIEVGYGLEGAVPDIYGKRIIENIIIPAFRGGQFASGIDQGVDALIKLADGEDLPVVTKATSAKRKGGRNSLGMIFVLIFIASIVSSLSKKKGFKVLIAVVVAVVVWFIFSSIAFGIITLVISMFMGIGNSGRSGGRYYGGGFYGGGIGSGGGFSSGGGGFGGFSGGGGGFGGGGASGGW